MSTSTSLAAEQRAAPRIHRGRRDRTRGLFRRHRNRNFHDLFDFDCTHNLDRFLEGGIFRP